MANVEEKYLKKYIPNDDLRANIITLFELIKKGKLLNIVSFIISCLLWYDTDGINLISIRRSIRIRKPSLHGNRWDHTKNTRTVYP